MRKNKPLVSVVMPAYNAGRFMAVAIESILNQTLEDLELVIVDDGSTDNTLEVAKFYTERDKRVHLISIKVNVGSGEARNIGVRASQGEYIALMDSDDLSYKNRLELQLKYLRSYPEVDVCIGNMRAIGRQGNLKYSRTYPADDRSIKKKVFKFNPFPNPTIMCRRSVLEEFSYSPNLLTTHDFDLWLRVGTKYKFGNVNKIVCKYRFSDTGLMRSNIRQIEWETFKLRCKAVGLGYRPGVEDIVFNLLQLLFYLFIPANVSLRLYDSLRHRNLI